MMHGPINIRFIIVPLKGWKSSNVWEQPYKSKHYEIKSRFNSRNACYHSVQNIMPSNLLSKYVEIKVYGTIILPVFCMGMKLGRSH